MYSGKGRIPILTGHRLELRPIAVEDAESLFACWSHPEVARWLGAPPLSSIDGTRELIAELLQLAREEESLRWSIVLPGGEVAGSCGFNQWQFQGAFRGELGCELSPACWGKSYMNEALGLLLGYGFEIMGLNRIEVLCHPDNVRAERLVGALGFQREGILRQYRHKESGFQDIVLYALLRRDWSLINDVEGREDTRR